MPAIASIVRSRELLLAEPALLLWSAQQEPPDHWDLTVIDDPLKWTFEQLENRKLGAMIERAGYPGIAADLDLEQIDAILSALKKRAFEMYEEGERLTGHKGLPLEFTPEPGRRRVAVTREVGGRLRSLRPRTRTTRSHQPMRRVPDASCQVLHTVSSADAIRGGKTWVTTHSLIL